METIRPDSDLDPFAVFSRQAAQSNLHKDVLKFLHLTNAEIVEIYWEQNPTLNKEALYEILSQKVNHFLWAGADVIPTIDSHGKKEMTIIEVNSCPTGNAFMASGGYGMIGYYQLIQYGFLSWLQSIQCSQNEGDLAVLIDLPKNYRECHVYATLMANLTGECVHLCNMDVLYEKDLIKWTNNQLHIKKSQSSTFIPIRAAFRKVVNKPWTKMPIHCKTHIFNPVLACLAGGRNKLLAAQAYQEFNSQMNGRQISIPTPHTTGPWSKKDIAGVAKELDYQFVIKCPFSNAGRGVHMITSQEDLTGFVNCSHSYDQFIVQSLIAPQSWKKQPNNGLFPRPVKTMGSCYLFDLRMMIVNGSNGWRPVCLVGRRATTPLSDKCPKNREGTEEMLKTNVSQDADSRFDTQRVITMSEEEFEELDLTLEDLVEAYVNSVLATVAIDDMCERLNEDNNEFNESLFHKWNQDKMLKSEIEEGKFNCF